jgi:(p)ppGpp synthase/HD superfamily hydrolase
MATLARALAIAAAAHEQQQDKNGAPYFLHVLRVMQRLRTDDETARIAAVLHDVVEDTDWTFEQLAAEGFRAEVIDIVDALTRRPDESYTAFVARAGLHPIARQVKLADLEDNMDLRRLSRLTPEAHERLERYHQAWGYLQSLDQPAP